MNRRSGLRVLAAGVLMAGTAGLCPGAQEALPEYEVKAAIIYNFARFTEWPADVLRGNEFPIGILGSETAQGAFQKVLRGKQIGDRQVRLLRGKTPEDLQDCVLIFVADSEKAHHVTLLDLYRKRPVLTIGETEGFAASGGILNFYLEATKVKFEINPDAAARAGLKVTKLIGVAPRKVKDR